MNIHRALSDIADIRAQLDRTEEHRGFRSLAVGGSVLFVIAGSIVQQIAVQDVSTGVVAFLSIWFWVAIASLVAVLLEMFVRGSISRSRLVWKMNGTMLREIGPCLMVGFVVTLLIAMHASEQRVVSSRILWALPGLWAMVYSLGLFSCQRHLPRLSIYVVIYFLVVGAFLLGWNWYTRDAAAWQMLASFGIGQSLLGLVLFRKERRHG